MSKVVFQHNLPIKSPRIPNTKSPRRIHNNNSNSMSLSNVETYLQNSLKECHSESDKVLAYQRTFDMLINQFQLVRPIVEQIKQEYDSFANSLLFKLRDIIANEHPETSVDDTYADVINTIRYSKNHEFAEFKEESERKLDYLTSLRLKHNELVNQLASIKVEYENIKNELEETTNNIETYTERVLQLGEDTLALKTELVNLNADHDDRKRDENEIILATEMLTNKENEVNQNIEKLIQEIEEIKQKRKDVEAQTCNLKSEFEDLKTLHIEIGLKNQNMDVKLNNQAERIASLEKEIRAKIGDETTPMNDIITKFLK